MGGGGLDMSIERTHDSKLVQTKLLTPFDDRINTYM